MKRSTLIALAFLACLSGGFAAPPPSKHDVLEAISVMEKSVSTPAAADAAKTVVIYAQVSDEVMVDIGPEQLPWVDEKWDLSRDRQQSCQAMLMAAFVAGNIRSQIKNDRAEDDTYSGWIFAIETYRRLKTNDPFVSPSLEALSKLQQEGKLLQHARDVHAKPPEPDSSDAPQRPLALLGPPTGSPA